MSDMSTREGHRKRLRDRFLKGGGPALADYELLELILFAIQRRDTKPLANLLIRRFGSLPGVLCARHEELAAVDGIGDAAAAALLAAAEAARRLAREEVIEGEILSSWERVIDYLRIVMAHQKTESFRVLFLDTRNRLIEDEEQQRGTVNHTPIYPRQIVARALELNATAVILVHNHPSGDPTPSQADIAMTHEVREVGKGLGVTLHDHVVVARGGHSSFRAMGLL